MSDNSRYYSDSSISMRLHNGDCISQAKFHLLYEQMPVGIKAELLNGIVYLCEPLAQQHGENHLRLGSLFDAYQAYTTGVQACDNATVILGENDEVQPDLFLRILPEFHGQTKNSGIGRLYVQGAPELIAEVAHSTRSMDLHLKRERYAAAGVIEYVVLCLAPLRLHWFDLREGTTLLPTSNGAFQSRMFPGLWIHEDALLNMDYRQVMAVLHEGLASREHEEFVSNLR